MIELLAGALLLVAGLSKVSSLLIFSNVFIQLFDAPSWIAEFLAVLSFSIELFLGVLLITIGHRQAVRLAASILYLTFACVQAYRVLYRPDVHCGCLDMLQGSRVAFIFEKPLAAIAVDGFIALLLSRNYCKFLLGNVSPIKLNRKNEH